MAHYRRIRRNRSALASGQLFGGRRRGLSPWFLAFWVLSMALMGVVVWQFNNIQPRVLALVGSPATPTPTNIEYAQRADDAFWRGDLDGAVESYRLAAQLEPENIQVLYELARVLIYRSYGDVRFAGDIGEAERWAAKAVEVAPDNARAHTIYCFALVRASKSSAAVQECLRALDLNRDDSETHAYLSMAQYDLARYPSAEQEGAEAIKLNPNSIDGNIAYATALSFRGQFQRALEYYQKSASINPKLEFPYFQMAFLAYTLANRNNDEGRYRIALAAYSTILQNNPRSVKAYTRMCQTYLAKGEPKLARQYCQQAIEIDPESSQAWRWLGEVYHKSRNYEDAVDALNQCADLEQSQGIARDLRDPTCYWLRGAGWFIRGDCDRAIQILEDALSWMTDEIGIRESRKIIDKCAQDVYRGTYKTPTPIPSPTPRPTPIL